MSSFDIFSYHRLINVKCRVWCFVKPLNIGRQFSSWFDRRIRTHDIWIKKKCKCGVFSWLQKSSTTKTTTMTTPAKLYGRELSAYDEVDVDELLAKLSQEELTMLAKEVDPDVSFFFIKPICKICRLLFWELSRKKVLHFI